MAAMLEAAHYMTISMRFTHLDILCSPTTWLRSEDLRLKIVVQFFIGHFMDERQG